MFPKPKSVLFPNTSAFESEPMVKATGFREYDARWLLNKEINLMGIQALGLGVGALIADLGADGRGLQGARYRPCADADVLFRAVRAGRAVRRHGDRLAQRQWLDRR